MKYKWQPLYSIQKINKQDVLYGPIHGSMDAETTLCGKQVDHNWYILHNVFDGPVTCKKCKNKPLFPMPG